MNSPCILVNWILIEIIRNQAWFVTLQLQAVQCYATKSPCLRRTTQPDRFWAFRWKMKLIKALHLVSQGLLTFQYVAPILENEKSLVRGW